MATTYEYATGRIERDFRFVKDGTKCRLSGLPCYAGSDRCKKCKHHVGDLGPLSLNGRVDGFWTMCNHPEMSDSEDCGKVRDTYYDYIEDRALCALDC